MEATNQACTAGGACGGRRRGTERGRWGGGGGGGGGGGTCDVADGARCGGRQMKERTAAFVVILKAFERSGRRLLM